MALATRKKPNSKTHRQRSGKHHRHSKNYVKTYWPYLPMLLMVVVGIAVNSLWSSQSVLGASSDFSSATLLNDTNAARAAASEPALTIDPQLSAAAQAKAQDMVTNNYWAHNSPQGKTPWNFIIAAGYNYQLAGENLAYGFSNADDTVVAWMNSAEHRANILNAGYANVGFGVAQSPNFVGHGAKTIVVAEYGQPAASAANITFTVPNPTAAGSAGLQDVKAANQIEPASQVVSRVQLLTGGKASWSLVAVSVLAGAAMMLFIVRHALWIRRAFAEGEVFISHHPVLDITVVFVITAGFILTRSSGFIK